jgi:hypothetical protein
MRLFLVKFGDSAMAKINATGFIDTGNAVWDKLCCVRAVVPHHQKEKKTRSQIKNKKSLKSINFATDENSD